jgi:hypothetical protein
MPPLHFFDEEMSLLLELARPIEPAQRSAFLDAVAEAIGGAGKRAGPRPPGGPADPAAILDAAGDFAQRDGARAPRSRRLKGEVQSWNTPGEAAILSLVERPGFVAWASVGHNLPPESLAGVAGMPLVLVVSRSPRVASALTRSQILGRHQVGSSLATTKAGITPAAVMAMRIVVGPPASRATPSRKSARSPADPTAKRQICGTEHQTACHAGWRAFSASRCARVGGDPAICVWASPCA